MNIDSTKEQAVKSLRFIMMLFIALGMMSGCIHSNIKSDKTQKQTMVGKDGKQRVLHCRYEAPTGSNIKKKICYWVEDLEKRRELDQRKIQRSKTMGMGTQVH